MKSYVAVFPKAVIDCLEHAHKGIEIHEDTINRFGMVGIFYSLSQAQSYLTDQGCKPEDFTFCVLTVL